MHTLAVSSLAERKHGTTSATTKSRLFGRLRIHSSGNQFQIGSIVLWDPITDHGLLCNVDRLHRELDDTLVCVEKWNYVCHAESGLALVEFAMEDIYRAGSSTRVITELAQADAVALNVAAEHCMSMDPPPETNVEPVKVIAKVTHKTVLTATTAADATFALIMLDEMDRVWHLVFQQEEAIRNYYDIQPGEWYLFMGLYRGSVLTMEKQISVWRYTNASRHWPYVRPESSILPSRPHLSPQQQHKNDVTTTGHITRVLDPLFGIYEINQNTLLCLFHYPGNDFERPLRVDTRIQIHHAHLFLVSEKPILLFHQLWHVPHAPSPSAFPVLVACAQTYIQILTFPAHAQLSDQEQQFTQSSLLHHANYMASIEQHTCFVTLLDRLELEAALQHKYRLYLDTETMATLLDSIVQTPKRDIPPLLTVFFCHDDTCDVTDRSDRRYQDTILELNSYPALKDIAQQMHDTPHEYLGAAAAHGIETERIQVAQSDLSSKDQCLGIVDVLADGRLCFLDDTHRIPLVLPLSDPIPIPGDMYLLKRARLVREDTSYVNETGAKILLDATYLVSRAKDLEKVGNLTSQSNQLAFQGDPQAVSHFTSNQANDDLCVFYVLERYPVEASRHAQVFSLQGRLDVLQYPVVSPGQPCDTPPCRVTLLLCSQTNTLRFHGVLRSGDWFGLSRMGDERFRVNPSQYKKASQVLQSQPPILFVGESAVLHHHAVDGKLPLHPVLATQPLELPQPCAMRPFSDVASMADGPPDRVDVQGIVLHKGWRGAFYNVMDPHANVLWRDLGVGDGRGGRIIFIRLQQTHGLDTMDIYMPVRNRAFPLGLVPGAHVAFRRLVRRDVSKHSYCIANAWSSVEILPPMTTTMTFPDTIPRYYLSMVLPYQDKATISKVFSAVATIRQILSLSLYWLCIDCGTVVQREQCQGMCAGSRRSFIAQALLLISDGTADVHAVVDGEDLVTKLLILTPVQSDRIKTAVLQQAASTGRWASVRDDNHHHHHHQANVPLEPLCARACQQVYTWYGRRITTHKDRRGQDRLETLQLRIVSLAEKEGIGRQERLALRPVRIKMVDIVPMDPIQHGWQLLSQWKSKSHDMEIDVEAA